MKLHLDIETYSECDLKKRGLYVYAEDPTTELLSVAYSFDDGPVHLWILYHPDPMPGAIYTPIFNAQQKTGGAVHVSYEVPADLRKHIESGGEIRAHNAQFERVVLNGEAGEKANFPIIEIEQMVCTMAKARVHGLRGGLEDVAKDLNTYPKNTEFKHYMLSCCKPRTGKIKRYNLQDDPERFLRLYLYNLDDVRAERGVDDALPDLTAREQRVWELDQVINDRGVKIDLVNVQRALTLIEEYKVQLVGLCKDLSGGIAPSQTGALASWVRAQGYEIENLQKETVKAAVKDPSIPKHVKRVLKIYSLHNMKAVSKYATMLRATSADGRLRGSFMFYGASTGRWSSRIVQLQNLFRSIIKDPDTAIDAFQTNLEWIRWLFDMDPMQVFASSVRGMVVADEGKDLLCRDFSAIESRIAAWLSGQLDKLRIYEGDGRVYEALASKMFRVHMDAVIDKQRLPAKVTDLACGFQGGVVAIIKMGKNYGLTISEEEAETWRDDWRAANKEIVRYWYALERAATAAIANPGQVFAPGKHIKFKVERRWLYMRLPSGRRLAYFEPRLDAEGKPTYLGIDTFTRQWKRVKTWGGKLLNNACEGIGRDLLVNGMFQTEAAGYPTIGTVHDEIVTEPDTGFGSEEHFNKLFCTPLKWAAGLPVQAEGFRAQRYRK